MSDIQQIIDALVAFRDEREWQQFHDTKNLAVALSIEAAELNELFLWKDVAASEEVDKEKIKEELADVLAYALLLAEKQGLDVKKLPQEPGKPVVTTITGKNAAGQIVCQSVIDGTRARYVEAYELLTGSSFDEWFGPD